MDDLTHGQRVKARILAAGLSLWPAVTARQVGKACGLSHGACLYHFGTADALRDAVAAEAIRVGDPVVVPQLIAAKHPAAESLPGADRARYLAAC